MASPLNIAVFASGKGSNFQAILHDIRKGHIPHANIVLVISNNRDAGALAIARVEKIPHFHLSEKQFASENEFVNAVSDALESHGVNFIVLAGYMKKIPSPIIQRYRNRIVNIHPALLPDFGGKGMYGMNVHRAVLESGVRKSGATVHIVDEEYDRGPIVLQREVDVDENETPESLAKKVLNIEHQLYPEAVRLFSEGRVKIDGGTVTIVEQT